MKFPFGQLGRRVTINYLESPLEELIVTRSRCTIGLLLWLLLNGECWDCKRRLDDPKINWPITKIFISVEGKNMYKLCDVENFYNSQVRLLQSNTETAIVWQCRLFYLDKSWTRGAATVLSKPLQIAVFHWRASVNVEIECKCGMDVLQEQHGPRSGIPRSNSWISTVYPDFNPLSL